MKSRKRKSKKPSAANKTHSPPDAVTFFIDRSLPKHSVTEALRDSGINVVHHDEIFKPDTPDTEWLAHAGAQGWAVLTKDKRIQYHPLEIAALLAAHVRTFVIATTANLTGEELAALAVKAMPKVRRIIQQTPPPFIAKIYRGGSIKIALKQGKKQHR